jgi:hypothetical protein
MTKERQSNKEAKKQPALNLKEKRTARKAKKDAKGSTPIFLGNTSR